MEQQYREKKGLRSLDLLALVFLESQKGGLSITGFMVCDPMEGAMLCCCMQ